MIELGVFDLEMVKYTYRSVSDGPELTEAIGFVNA